MGCLTRCCACYLLSQILCFGTVIGLIIISYLVYQYYLKPWGEEQLSNITTNPNISTSTIFGTCGNCTGNNNVFPTNTKGMIHFIDTSSAKTMSGLTILSIISGGLTSSIFAFISSSIISSGVTMSAASGFFEMFHIIGQAQFCSLLGMLQTNGAPRFLYEFSRQLAWTNLLIKKKDPPSSSTTTKTTSSLSYTYSNKIINKRRLELDGTGSSSLTGIQRYAWYLGFEPNEVFYAFLVALTTVLGIIFSLYLVVLIFLKVTSKYTPEKAKHYCNRVIWAIIQILILAQFGISMTSSFQISYSRKTNGSDVSLVLAIIILSVCTAGLIIFGFYIISINIKELDDVGKPQHERKPFNHKYGPYYQDFNKENRYFFAAKAFLDVLSGIIIGTINNSKNQIGLLIFLNLLYLFFLVWREPYLVRLFFYVGTIATFFRLVLLILTFSLTEQDVFPQFFRDKVSYAIIAINLIIFLCLIIRQLYVACMTIKKICSIKKKETENHESLVPNENKNEMTLPLADKKNSSNIKYTKQNITQSQGAIAQESLYLSDDEEFIKAYQKEDSTKNANNPNVFENKHDLRHRLNNHIINENNYNEKNKEYYL